MTTKFFEQLSSNLNELLKNSDEYNVIIEVGQEPNNQAFRVHSIILNSRCLYFKDKLGVITYNNNNVKIIKQLLKYSILSSKTVNVSVIFELLIASSEFGLEELIKHIQLFLLENNSSWLRLNFSRIYQTSFKNDNLKDLQQFCANIIAKHPNIIFDSDEFLTLSENILIFILKLDNLQMDEGKIWDYVIKWGIAQNPSLPLDLDKWNITINSHVLPPRINLPTTLPSRDSISIAESNKASELRKGGEAYLKIGWYKESLVDLTKSLDIEPNNAFALFKIVESCRGETYCWMDKFEESLADLNKSLEIEPNNTLTLTNQIEPNNAFALKIRGATYRSMRKYKDSLADLDRSLEIEPNDAWALNQRKLTNNNLKK
ncbi:hypothetical protein C2G38_2248270 [Gigaspora rosea]|uniref:Uncharacterized protein n=1 Tax=Gigaspora rosea TaxID=44941 RepID=A0A397UYD2_9GLOM|nr:hypothetical protein C2G38_2248270 [Gigaspora rosea]